MIDLLVAGSIPVNLCHNPDPLKIDFLRVTHVLFFQPIDPIVIGLDATRGTLFSFFFHFAFSFFLIVYAIDSSCVDSCLFDGLNTRRMRYCVEPDLGLFERHPQDHEQIAVFI